MHVVANRTTAVLFPHFLHLIHTQARLSILLDTSSNELHFASSPIENHCVSSTYDKTQISDPILSNQWLYQRNRLAKCTTVFNMVSLNNQRNVSEFLMNFLYQPYASSYLDDRLLHQQRIPVNRELASEFLAHFKILFNRIFIGSMENRSPLYVKKHFLIKHLHNHIKTALQHQIQKAHKISII